MKVIIHNLETFELSHISNLMNNIKTLEHKEGAISTLEIQYPKEIIRYTIVHNKKSYSVFSDYFDNKEGL